MIRAALFVLIWSSAAYGLSLPLPEGAVATREVTVDEGARAIPMGPIEDGFLPRELKRGAVSVSAYRIAGATRPALLLAPIEEALEAARFDIVFSCATQSCGGFDFRFELELIPPPDMFVDLGDFLFLSARSDDGARHVTVLASRSAIDGYLHIVEVRAPGSRTSAPVIAIPDASVPARSDIAEALETEGRIVLEDLIFASGTTTLPDDLYPSLTALAAYLEANPSARIALVGHTDATGALDTNITISRARAEAARTKLVDRYGIDADQVSAEGMGFLAPRTTNLTAEGRDRNRRVEAILISTGN
ncbi:MAG: OmpA family protein [Pseudomonadota bacterium]